MDLGQLYVNWSDWFSLSLFTHFPVESGLAGSQEWSDAIAPGIWWTFTEHRLAWFRFNQDPVTTALMLPCSQLQLCTFENDWVDEGYMNFRDVLKSAPFSKGSMQFLMTLNSSYDHIEIVCWSFILIPGYISNHWIWWVCMHVLDQNRTIRVCSWLLVITHYIVCSHLGSSSCSSMLLQTNKLVL